MCRAGADRCGRPHARMGEVLLRDHLGAAHCGPDCGCSCHERGLGVTAEPIGHPWVPTRRQHTGFVRSCFIYSDRTLLPSR